MDKSVEEILVRKYRNFIRKTAREYFSTFEWTRIDPEDILSEAMLGFLFAIRRLKISTTFLRQSEISCIKQSIRWYLRAYIWEYMGATRNGHEDVSRYGDVLYEDLAAGYDGDENGESLQIPVEDDTTHCDCAEFLELLSSADREMLDLRMSGFSVTETAEIMGFSRTRYYERLRRIMNKAVQFYSDPGGAA